MSQSASFDGGSLSLTQFGQIMGACDRFEAEWRAGRRPRGEQYLAEASEPCRAALLRELLALELELCRGRGERPESGEYRDRFPEHSAVVDAAFEVQPADRAPADACPFNLNPSWPVVDGYALLDELGSGGMGVVYRAHDRRRGADVALKIMRRVDGASLYRFKQEFRALLDVTHTNLVCLYELVSDGRNWFITMELIDGVDFLHYVRSAPRRRAIPTSPPSLPTAPPRSSARIRCLRR